MACMLRCCEQAWCLAALLFGTMLALAERLCPADLWCMDHN